ncbi:MAG: hypothetical protein QHH06_07855 [Clostridiales bacterium]|nr:hypothetical protein [Eubacteriales bacterium]MDH7566380.1 hypothetical protein [Clostridiales bacterium]
MQNHRSGWSIQRRTDGVTCFKANCSGAYAHRGNEKGWLNNIE